MSKADNSPVIPPALRRALEQVDDDTLAEVISQFTEDIDRFKEAKSLLELCARRIPELRDLLLRAHDEVGEQMSPELRAAIAEQFVSEPHE